MTAEHQETTEHRLAVVGMSCRYPGVTDIDSFWDLISTGNSGLTTLDDATLRDSGVPARLRNHRDYVPVAGLVDHPDTCDAAGLGLSEAEAELMDPQQRLFCECSIEALEAAGLGRDGHRGVVGVYAGQALPANLVDNLGHRYHPHGGADPVGSLHLHGLNAPDHLPARVAWLLGLTGPTVAVGATCATSLVAIHLAANALLDAECDTAIAGGVSLRLPQERGYLAVPDGPFSRDGHTRAYGDDATGTVFTQGAGVVVLRRLDDALRDEDPVHAVVLGTTVGNDGPDRVGFTAPSVTGQARVIAEALAVADIPPARVGLIEGHGTGTMLGDPVEVRALNEVFGTTDAPWCALGSVKSQIGHTDAAAGVAGFIKAVLAVKHGVIPPTLGADRPNPLLPLDGSAFILPTRATTWDSEDRIAGVSSFGIGGINAHALVGQAPDNASADAEAGPFDTATPLLLSAATPAALEERTRAIGELAPTAPLDRVASTLAHGVRHLTHRTALVDSEPTPTARSAGRPHVVAVFPGGGAQYAGMAAGLAANPVFARSLDESAAIITRFGGPDPRGLALDPRAPDASAPLVGLPALAAVELAALDTLAAHGLRPDTSIGHSLGEYVAAVAAGAMSRTDALHLVVERARLMGTVEAGAMVSVAADTEHLTSLLRNHPALDVAAVNGPLLSVITGSQHAVAALEEELTACGIEHRHLPVSVGAHSRLVDPIVEDIRALAATFDTPTPTGGLVSCLTAARADGPLPTDHWARHLREPVRFADGLTEALRGHESSLVLQLGPGGDLAATTGLTRDVTASLTVWPRREDAADPHRASVALNRCLAQAWSHGADLDLEALVPHAPAMTLPAYPWQRTTSTLPHRIAADGTVATDHTDSGPSADEPLQRPVWRQEPRITPRHGEGTPTVAIRGAEPAHTRALTDALAAHGVHTAETADLTIHISAPADVDALRDETRRFIAYARDAATTGPRPRGLLHLTLGAEDVLGTETLNPHATATSGLARVLGQEVEGLTWATVDLDPAHPAWDRVAEEAVRLHHLCHATADTPAPQPHRALRGDRTWARRWEHWIPENPLTTLPRTWVITGGMGTIGLALAERINQIWPEAHIVLAGRSLPEPGSPRAEAVAQLSHTETAQVDVARPGALTQLLQDVYERHGGPDVVIHAPVQVDLAPLAEIDDHNIDAAFAPKILGADELATAAASLPEPPRVLLLSSAAGTIGGFGLAAYVTAGRYLDGVAGARGWTTLDLDRVRLGTDAERAAAAEISMRHALDLTDVVTTVLRVATLDVRGQLAASPDELDSRTAHLETHRSTHDTEDTPDTSLDGWERTLADIWHRVLGRRVTHPQADFFALGGHSLLATRVLAALRDEHDVDIRLRDLLAAPTLAECSALVAERAATAPTDHAATRPVSADSSTSTTTGPDADSDGFGLSRVQHAYWIGRTRGIDPSRPGGDGVGCHFYLEYEAHDLDLARYRHAWRTVVHRHPMLRAVITDEGTHHIRALPADWGPTVVDLRDTPDQHHALTELREKWSTRVADPTQWPLVQPVVARLTDALSHVLLSVDVLVCDSASWMLVDRQIHTLYDNPEADLGPVPPTFADCLTALDARRGSPAHQRAQAYWEARIPTLPAAPDITDHADTQRPHFTRLAARVPRDAWQPLTEEAAQHHATPTALVLARYREALAAWSGAERFTITMTVFDRPDIPHVDDVVGEFTTMLLHEAHTPATLTGWDHVRTTQERLLDDLDHREYSGLEVLTSWSRLRGRSTNVPVVFTSMLGLDRTGEGTTHDHEWLGHQVHGVSQTPQVWLDHQAFEHNGDLVLQWDVCDSVIDLVIVQKWFDRYVASFTGTPTPLNDAPETATEHFTEATAAKGTPADTTARPLTDEATRSLVTVIWADLLGCDPDEIDDQTFLALGGDSLMAVRMAAELRKQTGITLPLAHVRADITVDDVIALLQGTTDGPTDTALLQRRPDPSAPFPLLPLQQGYFVGQTGGWDISYDTAHVTTDIALDLPDDHPDLQDLSDRLQRAADTVAAHQPMVRARILPDGTQQLRHPDDPEGRTPTSVIDLREADDPEAELDTLRHTWATRGPDPRTGAGVHVDVVLLHGRKARLHVSSSLLVMDGWSASLYDRELFTQLAHPDTAEPPLDIDFGDYVEAVTSDRFTDKQEQDIRWWCDRIADMPEPPQLPRRAGRAHTSGDDSMNMREFRLDTEATRTFRAACHDHGVTPTMALLGCYAMALRDLTGQDALLLTSLQHNRRPLHPDVDRLIGAFSRTALLPLRLPTGTVLDVIRSVTDQAAEHDRHDHVTAIDVGRRINRARGRTGSVAPVVFQSTLGMDRALGGGTEEDLGPFGHAHLGSFHQDIRTPQVELELRFFELDDELIGSMAGVDAVYEDGVPDRLLNRVRERVTHLLDPRNWDSPADTVGPGDADTGPADNDLRDAAAEVWAQILGLPHTPTPGDDFFELGGDSLLAVRMLLRLRNELGIDMPTRVFLENPTLDHLTRAGTPVPTPARTSPLTMSMRNSVLGLRTGTGTPVWLLHPSGGDVLCYIELARLLDTDRPVKAISDPGLDGHPMPNSIRGMVDLYAGLVTEHQPHGPYTLGGWSMGGTVAHELARRLTNNGHTVDALVMIDSNSPERIIRLNGLGPDDTDDRQRLRQLRSTEAFLGLDLGPHHHWRSLADALVEHGAAPDVDTFNSRYAVFRRHMDTLAAHHAGVLHDTPTLLLRADQTSPRNSGEGMGVDDIDHHDLGWTRWLDGPLHIHSIDAHHYSVLRQPAVIHAARLISAFLAPQNP